MRGVGVVILFPWRWVGGCVVIVMVMVIVSHHCGRASLVRLLVRLPSPFHPGPKLEDPDTPVCGDLLSLLSCYTIPG